MAGRVTPHEYQPDYRDEWCVVCQRPGPQVIHRGMPDQKYVPDATFYGRLGIEAPKRRTTYREPNERAAPQAPKGRI